MGNKRVVIGQCIFVLEGAMSRKVVEVVGRGGRRRGLEESLVVSGCVTGVQETCQKGDVVGSESERVDAGELLFVLERGHPVAQTIESPVEVVHAPALSDVSCLALLHVDDAPSLVRRAL